MESLLDLTDDLPETVLEPGQVLIAQDEHLGRLYVLVEGSLVIERDGTPFASIDTPGAILGEMSAVLETPATATVRASNRCRVRVADDPIDVLTNRPGIALHALRAASSRLDNMTRYLTDVKQQYAERTGHLGMVDDVLSVLVHEQPKVARPGSAREPDPDY